MPQAITFSKSARKNVLKLFGKTIDNEGYIVEESDKCQRVLTTEGEPVLFRDFAGIRKGSEVFIKSDLPSLISMADHIRR